MKTQSSHYLTAAVARRAIDMAVPMIESCRQNANIVGSGFLYLVVMTPGRTPQNSSFEEAILYEHACGNRDLWDADYAGFARAKAYLSWTTGMDAHRVQTLAPHLLKPGDSLLWGGICLNGIVVAASGAFPWFDEAFAGTVAYCLQALAKEARAAEPDRPAL
jgi:hypothetical protein